MARILVNSTCSKCGRPIEDGESCVVVKLATLVTVEEPGTLSWRSRELPVDDLRDGTMKKVRFTSGKNSMVLHEECAMESIGEYR